MLIGIAVGAIFTVDVGVTVGAIFAGVTVGCYACKRTCRSSNRHSFWTVISGLLLYFYTINMGSLPLFVAILYYF